MNDEFENPDLEAPESPVTRARLQKLEGYQTLLNLARREGAAALKAINRKLAREDLFYLLVFILGRRDADNDWCFARCLEVQAEPWGYLDLWSRAHYKSTIITFAHNIQEILKDPEVTICIISYSKSFSESAVAQIKKEFEQNGTLLYLFPEIFWENPDKEAPKWSVKDGFVVKRKGNPREQTVEGFGLIDSQPTGRHFRILSYDDMVTQDSVTSSEMIEKTTYAWQNSLNIGSDNATYKTRIRYVGTRWHQADTYAEMIASGSVKPRIYPCTLDGKWPSTKPAFLPMDTLVEKYKTMGSRTFNAQMLLNPTPSDTALFQRKMLRYHESQSLAGLNVYILWDPAKKTEKQTKRKRGDYNSAWVLGLGADRRYRVLDMVRDKLSKQEKIAMIFDLVDRWRPVCVFWEGGAQNSDVEDIQNHMNVVNYHFEIVEISNSVNKDDIIPELEAEFGDGRILLPKTCIKTMAHSGERVDLVQAFINDEFLTYPFCNHDDMLNSLAFIKHKDVKEHGMRFPNRDDGSEAHIYRSANALHESQDWDSLNDGL